ACGIADRALVSGDSSAGKLTAAISSFGYSGTISHAVLSAGSISDGFVSRKINTLRTSSAVVYKFPHFCHHAIENDRFSNSFIVRTWLCHRKFVEFMSGHVLHNIIVIPGAAHMDLMLSAVYKLSILSLTSTIHVQGAIFRKMVTINPRDKYENILVTVASKTSSVEIRQLFKGQESLIANAKISVLDSSHNDNTSSRWSELQLLAQEKISQCDQDYCVETLYKYFSQSGFYYGDDFQLLHSTKVGRRVSMGRIRIDPEWRRTGSIIPANVIDNFFQLSAVAAVHEQALKDNINIKAFVPYAVDNLWVRYSKASSLLSQEYCTCVVILRRMDTSMVMFDAIMLDLNDEVVMYAEGIYSRESKLQAMSEQVEPGNVVKPLKYFWQHETLNLSNPIDAAISSRSILLVVDKVVEPFIIDIDTDKQVAGVYVTILPFLDLLAKPDLASGFSVVIWLTRSLLVGDACPGSNAHTLFTNVTSLLNTLGSSAQRILLASLSTEVNVSNVPISMLGAVALSSSHESKRCQISTIFIEDQKQEVLLKLVEEAVYSRDSTEIMYKGGRRYKKTLEQCSLVKSIKFSTRGKLENLKLLTEEPKEKDTRIPNGIVIATAAVSLNFRDVLNVLGMYPGDPGDPGCEFAGKVVAVGSDVTKY
ncbi:hypothetical protein EON65_53435, partial [archaeon]